MATLRSGLAGKTIAVMLKDIRSEFKTRYAISAIVMFAVMTVAAVGFSAQGIPFGSNVQAVLMWLVIYFSVTAGAGQSFIKEEENETATALRLYAPATAVFSGKYLFNLLLLLCLEVVIIPLFAGLVGLHISSFGLFAAVLILTTIGLSAAVTLIAAIISRASIKNVLLTVLAFPIILPLLVTAIKATSKSLAEGVFFVDGLPELKVLLSYAVVMTAAGFLLFEYIWNE